MGENDKKEAEQGLAASTVAEAKGLIVAAYNDAVKPTASVVGATMGSVARLLMRPLKALADRSNEYFDQLARRVEKKLEDVPPDRQLPPPANIAGQVMFQYALLGDQDARVEQLREMFANLLASSIDSATADAAHPSFVAIISQLSPDEARLFAEPMPGNRATAAVIECLHATPDGSVYRSAGRVLEWGENVDFASNGGFARALSSLERLGLIEFDWSKAIADPAGEIFYAALEERARKTLYGPPHGRVLEVRRGIVQYTTIGEFFLQTCVRPEWLDA